MQEINGRTALSQCKRHIVMVSSGKNASSVFTG